jgi:hypothetical protein
LLKAKLLETSTLLLRREQKKERYGGWQELMPVSTMQITIK